LARPICILHLSDLHYGGMKDADTKIVIDALLKDIEREVGEGTVFDLVIFSGDLVGKCQEQTLFDEANNEVIAKIAEAAKLSDDQFVFCPGNHDLDREIVRKDSYVEVGLLSVLKNKTDINNFVDANAACDINGELPAPFQRLQTFYHAIWSKRVGSAVLANPFVLAQKFSILGHQIGVAAFNTAWRATGEPNDVDQGNLIIGERAVDLATTALKDFELKIAVFHHPTDWLHDPDRAAVENRLHSEFDLLFSGHLHRAAPEQRRTISGDVVCSQGASLYNSREYFNGYNIVRVHLETSSVEIAVQEYADARRRFIPAERILDPPIMNFVLPARGRRALSPLTAILLRTKASIRNLANKHISILGGRDSQQVDIATHFAFPELTQGASIKFAEESDVTPQEKLDAILKDRKSVVVLGRPEAGKTSLAHYMAVQTANGNADEHRLPIVSNFAELRKGDRILWRLLRDYASEISESTVTRQQLEQISLLVLVDNVDLLDTGRLEILAGLIASCKNVRWILFATSLAGRLPLTSIIEEKLKDFEIVELHDLSRSAIRALSTSWMPTSHDPDKADQLYRSVMEQIERTGLPKTGYVVALIIWAITNKSRGELLNEAVLLQNIIDYMLGRMDYTGALRSELDFTTRSAILQHLAMHFKETGDVQPKNDALQFIIDLLDQKGLNYDAARLLNSFIDCGVLDELGTTVAFRYRRFQDFFVAGYLRDDSEALGDVKKRRYFDFARELDLFTARFRHESDLLEIGRRHLHEHPLATPRLSDDEVTTYLASRRHKEISQSQLRQMRREPMTAEKVDVLLDKTEKRVAERRAAEKQEKERTGVDRSGNLIKHFVALELYSQFIRNLEFIDKEQKRVHLRECFLGWERALKNWLAVISEVMPDVKKDIPENKGGEEKLTKAQMEKLFDILEFFMITVAPTSFADMAYRTMGSEKLVEFVDELGTESEASTVFKLLCFFVLLELSPERGFERLRAFAEAKKADQWVFDAIIQRLFAYYRTRPLSDKLRGKFENLVADLQLQLSGGKPKRDQRGVVLSEIKKKRFKEDDRSK